MIKKIFHGLTLLVMLGIGIAGAMYLNKNKPTVERDESRLTAKVVNVMPIKRQAFRAHVTAYGNVAPALTLQGKAQVSGKVTYVHPELKAGGSIVAGTTVVKIDPEDYQVSLDQTLADLSASEAQREQILQEQRNSKKTLDLAQRNLNIGEKELARLTSLSDRGLIAASTVDDEAQKVLQLRQSVTDLEGQLATYRSRLDNAEAQIKRAKQQVKGQKTTLGRTEVKIPFDARVNVANVEKGEFVSVGNTLFEASNVDGVEIQAELPMQHTKRLLSAIHGASLNVAPANSAQLINDIHLKAQVRWVDGGEQAIWEARV
ncbi:MAG TPA: HlyD family secretion protein, partial [Thiothrix sp.]|nr:HlyD family secretion protein [Thiothrix sp.]